MALWEAGIVGASLGSRGTFLFCFAHRKRERVGLELERDHVYPDFEAFASV